MSARTFFHPSHASRSGRYRRFSTFRRRRQRRWMGLFAEDHDPVVGQHEGHRSVDAVPILGDTREFQGMVPQTRRPPRQMRRHHVGTSDAASVSPAPCFWVLSRDPRPMRGPPLIVVRAGPGKAVDLAPRRGAANRRRIQRQNQAFRVIFCAVPQRDPPAP